MSPEAVVNQLKAWFTEERLTVKAQNDPRAHGHFMVKYPGGKQGHMFAVVVPKQRDLVAISSMTRVDEGQQHEMKSHMEDEDSDWSEWVHESRLHLIRTGVDWAIHMGHEGDAKPGPLQAFNVSLPIWYDGLTKNEFMNSLRKLWLAKLALIHEIKYSYGPGVGKPGPVDDWAKSKAPSRSGSTEDANGTPAQVEFDEKMAFGTGLDPDEWA
jgi:hypothetical protein